MGPCYSCVQHFLVQVPHSRPLWRVEQTVRARGVLQSHPATQKLSVSIEKKVASPAHDGLDERFDAIRQDTDITDISRKQMRASLREKLFGAPADPVRLGRFVIIERLGQGGMGVVYSAYDPDLDRRVAIKLLRRGMGSVGQHATERLRREAQALARLAHPNVVAVHEVGIVDAQVFVVMEFVVGRTLRDWARDDGRPWRDILDAYRQAGEGLAAAHRRRSAFARVSIATRPAGSTCTPRPVAPIDAANSRTPCSTDAWSVSPDAGWR